MSTAQLTAGTEALAIELHGILKEFDPARRRSKNAAAAAERLAALAGRAEHLLSTVPEVDEAPHAGLRARVAEMRATLLHHAERWRAGEHRRQLHRSLQHRYEALADALREYRIHVPALRPTNYARNIFHVCWGLFALLLILVLLPQAQLALAASLFAAYAWTLEIVRKFSPAFNERVMRLYGKVAHPHEWNRVNSGTWYATALVILAMSATPLVCGVAVAILTFADPAAALIGRRWGRTKLVHGRSLEGSGAFFVVGTTAALTVGLLGGLPLLPAAVVGACAAFVACLAELFSHRVDDNLTVPVAGMLGAWLGGWLLSMPV
jgi:dolichol kinase